MDDPATRQIPWLRVFLEGVVIVGSILLAFGLQAWWEGRQERGRVEANLANIAAEIAGNRDEIAGAIARNRYTREIILGVLLREAPELAALPADSLTAFVEAIRPPRTYDAGGAALESLLSGGDLALVDDAELSEALVRWHGVPDEMEENWSEAYQAAQNAQAALNRHGVYDAYAASKDAWSPGYYGDMEWDPRYPARGTLAASIASLIDDREAVDAVATLALHNLWFSTELEYFVPVADSLLVRLR
jgi:hypothetical protein